LKRICRRESIDCCAIVLANIVGFGCVTAMLRHRHGCMGGVQRQRTPGSETVPGDSPAHDRRLPRGRPRERASSGKPGRMTTMPETLTTSDRAIHAISAVPTFLVADVGETARWYDMI
jgi:hypothetical protein